MKKLEEIVRRLGPSFSNTSMASLDDHRPWLPYMNGKDCSQGFCTFYCPQWCYRVFTPPPPYEFPEDNSSPSFSPLVIAIIGVLASAFLLVSYYTLISKYCGSMDSTQTQSHLENEELEDNHNPNLHEPWQAETTGLDEALIKTITVCKYKKEDELVAVADCSVCLSEFEEDENIRLLPKCSHAFHLPCIDTWLKSHSNCPLCRANIFSFNTPAPHLSPPVIEIPSRNEAFSETQNENDVSSVRRDHETGGITEEGLSMHCRVVPKPALRVFSDLGNSHGRDTIIEIKDEGYNYYMMRRSISMDHSLQNQTSLSVADVLQMNQDEDSYAQDQCSIEVGSSKQSLGETSRSRYKRRVLHSVLSPIAMKRSFSSGRFLLPTHSIRDRQQATIPV